MKIRGESIPKASINPLETKPKEGRQSCDLRKDVNLKKLIS